MSSFPILDLVVGLIFVYFLLSIICSSVVEMILTVLKARSALLKDWLCKIFDQQVVVGGTTVALGQAIMDHCSVTVLSEKKKSPSYIDAKNFASALLEKLTFDPDNPNSIANDLDTFIDKLKDTDILSLELKRVLLTYAYEAKNKYQEVNNKVAGEVELFRSKIENWYDTSMDRLAGDLKRKYARPFTLIVAAVATLLMNADSLSIARYLYSNPEARAKVAAQAYQAADSSGQRLLNNVNTMHDANDTTLDQAKASIKSGLQNIKEAQAALAEDLPFGWDARYFQTLFPYKSLPGKEKQVDVGAGLLAILSKLIGLAATAIALMMGAPFWFDLLNKVSNLRGTGNKPATSSSASPPAPAPQPSPVTLAVTTNTEEEAVG